MYFVIVIQFVKDGTTPCNIFSFNTKVEASSYYHNTLASCYINENLNDFLVQLIDDNGIICSTEKKGIF